MPKVAQTFKERAIDYAMNATPEETNEIVTLMKQIAKNLGRSTENGTPKPTRKKRAHSTQTITAQDHTRDDATG